MGVQKKVKEWGAKEKKKEKKKKKRHDTKKTMVGRDQGANEKKEWRAARGKVFFPGHHDKG